MGRGRIKDISLIVGEFGIEGPRVKVWSREGERVNFVLREGARIKWGSIEGARVKIGSRGYMSKSCV